MIEAVNINPAAAQAPAAQAPAAGTDIFAQIMAAVAAGLAAGSVSPETCLEPAFEGAETAPEAQAGAEGEGRESDGEENCDLAMAAAAAALAFITPCRGGLETAARPAPAAGSEKPSGKAGVEHMSGKARGLEIRTADWLLGGRAEQAAAGTGAVVSASARAPQAPQPEEMPRQEAAVFTVLTATPQPVTAAQPAAELPPVQETPAAFAEPGAEVKSDAEGLQAAEQEPAVKPAPAAARKQAPAVEAGYESRENSGEACAERAPGDTAPTEEQKTENRPERNQPAEAVREQFSVRKVFAEPKSEAGILTAQSKVPLGETQVKAAAGESAPATLPAETVRRLAEAACDLEAAGRGSVNFEINDGELGKLRVEMSLDGGDVKIRLETENGETGRFISEKTSDLVDALAQRGVSGEVSVFSGEAGGQGAQGRGRARHNPRFEPAEQAAVPQEETPAEEKGRLNVYA